VALTEFVRYVRRVGEEGIQFMRVSRSTGTSNAGKGQAKVTTMLLVVSFAWLVLTTPFAVCGFIFAVGDVNRELAGLLMPFKAVAFLLMYTNHAVNFYLYCITGRKFRRELLDALAACRCSVADRWCQQWTTQQSMMTTGNGGLAIAERGILSTSIRLR